MYLQITTKCNMACEHCCFSCTKYGRHGKLSTIIDAIAFARDIDEEFITIGGGEPTLHPDFFKILKICLQDIRTVWMATNGSQSEVMYRLANILNDEDYPECDCEERYGKEEYETYGCMCHERMDYDRILSEDQLCVALSKDPYHDAINDRVERIWRTGVTNRASGFQIRDHTNVYNQGRAKLTGAGTEDGCACADIIIKPSGRLVLCACPNSPTIGDVWRGINDKWKKIMESDRYKAYTCYKEI